MDELYLNQFNDLARNQSVLAGSPGLSRLGPTSHAMAILSVYRVSIGAAKIIRVIGSPVGVMTAATMKMSRTAILNCLMRNRAVSTFILARKNTTVGIWKMKPRPISIF